MSQATPEQLREAVTSMDGMASSAFTEIATLASFALLAMEQPRTYANGLGLAAIATALNAIKSKADDADNCINATAEGVQCNHVDAAQGRRWQAERDARKASTSGRA